VLGQAQEVAGVRVPHLVLLAGLSQPFRRVDTNGLQQVVTPVGVPGGDDQRLVHQRSDHVDEAVRITVRLAVQAAYLRGRVRGGAPAEHRQPAKHRPFRLVEQVPAPVDDGAQRLMPGRFRPGTGGQQPETVMQPFLDLGHGQ
jgi:hypothetical protein